MQNFPESLAFALVTVTMTAYIEVTLIKEIYIVDYSIYIFNIITILYTFIDYILAKILES